MAAGTAPLYAGFIVVFLLGAGSAVVLPHGDGHDAPQAATFPSAAPMDHEMMHGMSHGIAPAASDLDHPPELAHEPPFPLEGGKIPTLDDAQRFSHKYSRFIAKGDEGIDKLRTEGYLSGDGTPQRPYVLEDFYVTSELSFTSINRSMILRNGYVAGQLKLDYVGESLYVHHVYADDLRVNENVKRTAPNTGGLFEHNKFAFVGQIRHFVGEFTDNEIGPKPANVVSDSLGDAGVVKIPAEVVFNFDGFHRADVHHNHFLGMVDIKLHGHNHGDCFTCDVHDHSDAEEDASMEHDHMMADDPNGFDSHHQVRYSSLLFRDNVIEVPSGIALRYNDRNHAGDDRTANSEPNKRLDDPHVHYQDITIRGNKLVGGGMLIDIFNAPDDKHTAQNIGELRIWHNDITVRYAAPTVTQAAPTMLVGIQVQIADGLQLSAKANEVRFEKVGGQEPGAALGGAVRKDPELRGFYLVTADASNMTLLDNIVDAGTFGVFAESFSDSVFWTLSGNDFHTATPWRGKDVEHAPEEKP